MSGRNQYDLRLQTVGLSVGHDDIVVRGRPETRSFSIVYRHQGRVIALDCVNATKDYVQGGTLLRPSRLIGADVLAATRLPLTALAWPIRSVRAIRRQPGPICNTLPQFRESRTVCTSWPTQDPKIGELG